jgi:hypothetical protein
MDFGILPCLVYLPTLFKVVYCTESTIRSKNKTKVHQLEVICYKSYSQNYLQK